MREAGFHPGSVTVAGGATRSDLWLQTHADVSGVPFILTKVHGHRCRCPAGLGAMPQLAVALPGRDALASLLAACSARN